MDNKIHYEKQEIFLKAVVKSALSALLSIGVKSPEYIERFSVAFQNALEKNLALLPQPSQTRPQPQDTIKPEVVPENNSIQAPTRADKSKEDISTIIKNPLLRKSLRNAGIDTIEQLIIYGQQNDYATIKGIKTKSVVIISEAIKKWNS